MRDVGAAVSSGDRMRLIVLGRPRQAIQAARDPQEIGVNSQHLNCYTMLYIKPDQTRPEAA
jgi:hypothetical protein